MKELAKLPDRFNAHFATRGWIATEEMNVETAQKAVAVADQGKHNDAEKVLTDYWTRDIIDFRISRLKRVNAFPPRWQLAQDALKLYDQGQYNACALLVFAIMDGMVQETSAKHLQRNQNASAEQTDMQARRSSASCAAA